MPDLEFYAFGFASYPNIPHAEDMPRRNHYIDSPSDVYDPERGQWVFDSFIDTLVFCEKLGFDGVATNTQMGHPGGLQTSANLLAGVLAAATERIKIASLGPILNTYLSPMRVAEEIALVDLISKGRLIWGLPMGHGQNWQAAGGMNPSHSRDRHWEAHDLIIKAFTEPGPFEWQGDYFHVPYANLWPRPVQQPFPEIWVPSAGSRITFEKCAEHRYTYQTLFAPRAALKRNVDAFRKVTEEYGYTADPKQIAAVLFVHVAETDRQARLEAEPHVRWMFQNAIRANRYDGWVPGHFSPESMRGFLQAGGYRDRDIGEMSYDEIVEEGWGLFGSPDTVAEQLEEIVDELGAGRIVLIVDNGAMPNWMVRKSLTLMAEQVFPRFRPPGGAPIWAREDDRSVPTHAQYGAYRREHPLPYLPEAVMPDGRRVDVGTSHVVADR